MTTKKNEKGETIGCYQLTYCSECMAFPFGLGCPERDQKAVQRFFDRYEDAWNKLGEDD